MLDMNIRYLYKDLKEEVLISSKVIRAYPVMVYTFESDRNIILSIQVSDIYDAVLDIDLLFFKNGENSHNIYIPAVSKLVGSQWSNYKAKNVCRRCLFRFYNNEDLFNYLEICIIHESVKPIMPKAGETFYLKNYRKKIEHPYVIL